MTEPSGTYRRPNRSDEADAEAFRLFEKTRRETLPIHFKAALKQGLSLKQPLALIRLSKMPGVVTLWHVQATIDHNEPSMNLEQFFYVEADEACGDLLDLFRRGEFKGHENLDVKAVVERNVELDDETAKRIGDKTVKLFVAYFVDVADKIPDALELEPVKDNGG